MEAASTNSEPNLGPLERAEARLRRGDDGLSVESGEPIPDVSARGGPNGRAHRRRGGAP